MARVKIADLVPVVAIVDVSSDQQIELRPLDLSEMVQLFLDSQDLFMAMYSSMQTEGSTAQKLAPLLTGAPDFVARCIALAAGEPGTEAAIRKIAPGVQLIAVYKIWKMSVPDPKALGELLSVVMAELRKLSQKVGQDNPSVTLPKISETVSQPLSSSSSPTVTEKVMSGGTA